MKQVTEKLWIGPQPGSGDMEAARDAGAVRVINNRPNNEEPGQPLAEDAAREATALGMDYVHIPVAMSSITEEDVRAFQRALDEADGPVLAHCKSGMRSLTLYAIGEALDGRMSRSAIDALADRTSINLVGAKKAWLDNHP